MQSSDDKTFSLSDLEADLENQKLIIRARDLAKVEVIKKIWLAHYRSQLENGTFSEVIEQAMYDEQQNKVAKCSIWYGVITATDDTTIDSFVTKINRFFTSQKKFKDYVYTFEYYSEKHPDGGNLHCHFLAMAEKPITRCVLSDSLKRFNGWKAFHPGDKPQVAHQQYDYILGKKTDDKSEYIEKDILWRQEKSLQPFYGSGEPFLPPLTDA